MRKFLLQAVAVLIVACAVWVVMLASVAVWVAALRVYAAVA